MNRIILLLLILACNLSTFARGNKKPMLRFDGLYQTNVKVDKDGDSSRHYLRFYADGTVIAVSSTGSAEDLRSWFNRKLNNSSVGKYKIKGREISFPSSNSYGTVEYDGNITNKELLDLHVKSLINQHERQDQYVFVKVVGLK